jgi:Tol biopolymer transport system component
VNRLDSRISRAIALPVVAVVGWLVALGAIAKTRASTGSPTDARPYRFAIELPDSVSVANGMGVKLGISPDGSQLAVVGMKAGRRALYLRRSDDIEARLVPGTDSAFNPGFSPDGRWLLFQTGSRLMKVRTAGGPPEPVLDSVAVASWGDDGSILFERGNTLWRLGAGGGEPRRVATPDAGRGHRRYSWPEFLPGSEHALITIWRGGTNLDSARLGTLSLDDGTVTDLEVRGANAHYASGHLVYAHDAGSVSAIPFSLRRRATTGAPTRLLQNVWTGGGGGTDFAVSHNGALAYHGGVPEAEEVTMRVVDRSGTERQLPQLGRQRFLEPRLSPDGRRVAVSIGPPPPGNTGDVWVYDLATGVRARVSTSGVNIRPEWTRDGTRVVWISRQADSQFVVARRWDLAAAPEVLARGAMPAFYELSMGPARGWTAVRTGLARGGSALEIAPTESLSARRPFDADARVVVTPSVAPNGRLIAYVATEAGRRQVFVRPLPGPGPRVAVSIEGGSEPAWSPDGSTLYFRGLTHFMAARIAERPTLSAEAPVALFPDTFRLSVAHTGYDVFPNGREFLMLGGWGRAQSRAYVVVNWTETLGKPRGATK